MLQTVHHKGDEDYTNKTNEKESHKQETEESKTSLYLMVLMGLIISGMIESYVFPKPPRTVPSTAESANNSSGKIRRYCDPPNVTVLSLYDIYYDSEEDDIMGDYDFAQMEEMDFMFEFNPSEMESQRQWQIFLLGSIFGPALSAWSAPKFGPGRVFGFCILTSSVIGMFSASADTMTRSIIVGMQGVTHSKISPCCILLGMVTVAEGKLTSFLALIAGAKAGSAFGELIPDQFLPFATCIIAVTWFSAWVLMFDTPQIDERKHPIPWKQLLTSRVVWMSSIVVIGAEVSQCAVTFTLRMYLYLVYDFTVRHILAAPMVGHLLFAIACGKFGEFIENTEVVTRTVARKTFVYISHFLPAAALFLSAFVGCDIAGPVILFAISAVLSGATYSGAYASMLDIAPNFAPLVVGFVSTCGSLARLTPVLLTSLICDGNMPGSWRTVLSLSSLTAVLTAMLFMLRGNSRHQPWNDPELQKTQPRRSTARLNMEGRILKVLMVQEREHFSRARACSASISTNHHHISTQKRASLS